MQNPSFSALDLDQLAQQVDQELTELKSVRSKSSSGLTKHASTLALDAAPVKQRLAIEKATGESADSFWQRYKEAACKDLCLEGGQMHRQWQEFSDLKSKDAVKVSVGILAGLGISGPAIPVVAVAATVMLLNIVLNIGVKAICAEVRR